MCLLREDGLDRKQRLEEAVRRANQAKHLISVCPNPPLQVSMILYFRAWSVVPVSTEGKLKIARDLYESTSLLPTTGYELQQIATHDSSARVREGRLHTMNRATTRQNAVIRSLLLSLQAKHVFVSPVVS